jgi:hypothetical protein
MKRRCDTPGHISYRYYGGKGVRVCQRWVASFEAFLADMGPKPSSKHSLDRIDRGGDYEPGNCRWATATEQALNTVHIVIDGEPRLAVDVSAETGIPVSVMTKRLKRGWSPELAATKPLRQTKRSHGD